LKEIRVLDAAEVEALLDAAWTARWKAALGLMALAGLRLGETRALT
jgi:integrase